MLVSDIKPYILTAEDEALISKMKDACDKAFSEGGYRNTNGEGYLVEWDKGDGSNNIAALAFINEEGDVYLSINQACHASMSSPVVKRVKFILNAIMDQGARPIPKDVEIRYIDYIVNRSPYNMAFVRKDTGENIRKWSYTVGRADVPANYVASAFTALRMAQEHGGSVALIWDMLTQRGLNEDLAYMYAFAIRCSDAEYKWLNNQPLDEWHSSIDGRKFGKTQIVNYLNHELNKTTDTLHDQAKDKNSYCQYTPMCNMWGPTGGDRAQSTIDEAIGLAKAKAVHVKPPVNPFAAGRPERKDATLSDFLDEWVPLLAKHWEKEVGKEMKAVA